MALGVYLLVFALISKSSGLEDAPIVRTKVGDIEGVRDCDGNYTKYLGIPYAKLNHLNVFGDSFPYPRFENVFKANNEHRICPQITEFNVAVEGSILDCLNLNIYVPNVKVSSGLPVMVYIYGGRFKTGFAGDFYYGPKFLVRHEVILVTLNYRTGPYGFMCLDIPEVPGNQGIKDQVRALKWVKENIEAFGGDPEKITLFGHSAGSMSADLHLLADEKIFNKVILQSGTSLLPQLFKNSEPKLLLDIATKINSTEASTDVTRLLANLSTLNPIYLMNVSYSLKDEFFPCIEKKIQNTDNFVDNYPINIKTDLQNVTIMIGYTPHETLQEFAKTKYKPSGSYKEEFQKVALAFFNTNLNITKDELREIVPIFKQFYAGDNETKESVLEALEKFHTDFEFIYPATRSIPKYFEQGVKKVYSYVFSYSGKRNFGKKSNGIEEPGVTHADELGYLFDMKCITDPVMPDDEVMIDRMTTMWTNFAKYGDPTPALTKLMPVRWRPITEDSPYNYLNIDLDMKVGTRYNNQRMAFWDLLYKTNPRVEKGYGYVPTS